MVACSTMLKGCANLSVSLPVRFGCPDVGRPSTAVTNIGFHIDRIGQSDIGPIGGLVWSNSGWRSLNVGGNWNNGSNAGVANLNGNNDLSNSNSNNGARLAYPSLTVGNTIKFGSDLASWQKNKENDSRSTGRRGQDSASEGRIEVDRNSKVAFR